MANVTRSGRKLKDDDNNLKRRQIGSKGSSALGSPSSDTSGLRKSTRETPSKKESAPSPVSIRKSERIEKRTPTVTPIKKKLESVEKQRMPSPLRRSERGDNSCSSSSQGLRKFEKVLDFSEKSKKENRENDGKCKTASARDGNKHEEKDQKPVRLVSAKKRLDARTYRASLLRPQAVKTQESDHRETLTDQDEASQVDIDATEASSSEDVEDIAEGIANDREETKDIAEGIANDWEETKGKDVGQGLDRVVEGPSSSLRKLEAGRLDDTREIELSNSSRKRKLNLDEFDESNHRDSSPVSKCSYNPLQPSPGVSAIEVVGDAAKVQVDCLEQHNLPNISMISASEGKSVPGDTCLEKHYTVSSSKGKRQAEDVDSDAIMMAANEETQSSADPVTSSPCDGKRGSLRERCESCSKRRRFEVDAQKCSKCTCNYEMNPDSLNNSSPEDGGELRSTDCMGSNEECQDKMQSESLLDSLPEYDHNACAICRLGGKLLCCDGKGCRKNYHLNCLEPPLKVAPVGGWFCFQCIKRKIQFGVHSVSEGVEFICDVKEEEVPDCNGIQKQKQYLVKYKGLAHVHNLWIPEHQLFLEAPSVVAKFKKHQVRWKLEWTKPQRLIRKRSLVTTNQQDANSSDCQCEWFVKWSGLGYEHATWELENAPFLRSPEVIALKRDYEARLEKAILVSNPSKEKTLEERECPSFKLSDLACKNFSRLDNDHSYFVNKLREHRHKNQNVVVVEDQERIWNVVIFILLSLQSDVCRPFLIISTSNAISAWEAEFMRSASSVNVVVYTGNKNIRESIRAFEFYEDGGCVMLQVLLSPIDAVVEDLGALELIGWEAIVVDECQRPTISKHLEQIKKLPNGFRLLLLSGLIKESIAEYLNLLSFIEPEGDRNGDGSLKVNAGDTISTLRERFSRFVACERKLESSKFLEYWIPVHLSSVQLEQYCATLLSNSLPLCSCSKNDPVGVLRDVLISVRKCCDHPYLTDKDLQSVLTKDLPEVEYLDVGVNASGKLQLLDKVLLEIKKRGLRVVILFQSIGGSGRNCIGDILDDFLRQRFGPDSYERVDSGLLTSKKQAAMNMFNNKERGRFVFLIENRACLPSIKLSSVDMVILFDSDWNPLNDLRSLQKITLDSQFEQLKVFRLYSSSTVEEKVLSLAKQDMVLDSNIQNINRSISHMLLLSGAKSLFQKLDEFHSTAPSSGSNISAEQSFLNDVVEEFLSELPGNAAIDKMKKSKITLMPQQTGTSYSKNITLLGEKEMQLKDEESPHILWTNILDGRNPRWRYGVGPSQRSRRKVQYYDDAPKKPQENDDASRKRKKIASITFDPNTSKDCLDNRKKLASMDKQGESGTLPCNVVQNLTLTNTNGVHHSAIEQPETHVAETKETRNLHDSQKDLHLCLKPVISKLCEILELPNDVKIMAGRFLEYVINNHNVSREPVAIFQAFQISLCWSAASLMKHKVSHTKSLSLAKQHLNFQCKDEETELIYSKLRVLKKLFAQQAKSSIESISTDNSSPRNKGKHHLHSRDSQSTLCSQELEEGEIRENAKSPRCSVQVDFLKQAGGTENGSGASINEFSKSIKEVKKTYTRRMRELYQRQMTEFQKFNEKREKILEKENTDLEIEHNLHSALIRSLHRQSSLGLEKLKVVEQEFTRKKEEGNKRMEIQQRKLEAMQRKARNEEKHLRTHWLEEAKSGRSVATYATQPLSDSGFREENMEELMFGNPDSRSRVEHMSDSEPGGFGHERVTSSSSSLEKEDMNVVLPELPADPIVAEICPTVLDDMGATEPLPLTLPLDEQGVEANTLQTDNAADMGSKQRDRMYLSDSGSRSLCQTLAGPALDLEHAAPSQDGLLPPLQVSIDEHSEPPETAAKLQELDVPVSEVRNFSEDEVQTLQPAGVVPSNQVNDAITVVPHAVHLQLSPSADPISEVPNLSQNEIQTLDPVDVGLSNQVNDVIPVVPPAVQLHLSPSAGPPASVQSHPETTECIGHEQTSESFEQLDDPIRETVGDQDVVIDHSGPVPGDLLQHVVSEQTTLPTSSAVLTSIAQGQSEAVEDQHVVIDHSGPIPGNLFAHAASVPTQLPASSAVLTSIEQGQCEAPASTVNDQEERNERDNSLQPDEALIRLPVLERSVTFNHSDPLPDNHHTAQPTQVPAHPLATVQTELLNSSILRPNAHSQHLSVESSGVRLSDPRSINHFPELIPRTPQISASRIPQQLYPDPLQNELGRLRREEEQTNKMYEDEKVRLSSECEREMEAIRKKYAALLQDAEMEFMERKKALETNSNFVFMNRILAEAFRLKCDAKTAGITGLPQGASSGSVQQGLRVSSPQTPQRPVPAPAQPTTSASTPPVQMVHQPSALFSSGPVRSQFCQVNQVGTELRAPAPHLQPYRPVTPMSHSNSTTSLNSHRTSRLANQSSAPFSRVHQSENMGGLQNSYNSSLSAVELLMDMERNPSQSPQTLLPPLQNIGQTVDTWEAPEMTTAPGRIHGPADQTSSTAAIVYLSDDD